MIYVIIFPAVTVSPAGSQRPAPNPRKKVQPDAGLISLRMYHQMVITLVSRAFRRAQALPRFTYTVHCPDTPLPQTPCNPPTAASLQFPPLRKPFAVLVKIFSKCMTTWA